MKKQMKTIGAMNNDASNNADVARVAAGIMEVLKCDVFRVWSWGPGDYCAVVHDNMPALRFTVQGFLFKGRVVVALNRGADLYEVYCIDDEGNAVKSQTGVYCDELTDVIDRMVEKDCPDEEYRKQVAGWL